MPPKRGLPGLSVLKRKLPGMLYRSDSGINPPPKRKTPGPAILPPAANIRPAPAVKDRPKFEPIAPAPSPETPSSKASSSPYLYNVYINPDFAPGYRTQKQDILRGSFDTLAKANTFAKTVLFTKFHVKFEDCEIFLDSPGVLRVRAVVGEESVRAEVWVVKVRRDSSELSIYGAVRSEIRRTITEERQSGALLMQGRECVDAWVVLEEGKEHEVHWSRYDAVAEVKRRMEEREHEVPNGTYMIEKGGLRGLRWSIDASGNSIGEVLVKTEKARLF